jgi:hypothetical protein
MTFGISGLATIDLGGNEEATAVAIQADGKIVVAGPAGDQPSPITGLSEPTRVYTLTGLTNYSWYTITLNALVDGGSYLTATATAMPTDIFVFLPVVLR